MTFVASFTRSYREAQTYLTSVLLVPTLPIAFASIYSLKTKSSLMLIPSLSQHLLMTSVIRMSPLRRSTSPVGGIVPRFGAAAACRHCATLAPGIDAGLACDEENSVSRSVSLRMGESLLIGIRHIRRKLKTSRGGAGMAHSPIAGKSPGLLAS